MGLYMPRFKGSDCALRVEPRAKAHRFGPDGLQFPTNSAITAPKLRHMHPEQRQNAMSATAHLLNGISASENGVIAPN